MIGDYWERTEEINNALINKLKADITLLEVALDVAGEIGNACPEHDADYNALF